MKPAELVGRLDARGLTVATAESLTGGMVCAALTDVPGASAVVRGGVISYVTEVKASVLGVDPDLLARAGAVDARVAEQMAEGVRRLLGAWFGVSTTGVAGPGPADGRPVGTVFVAVSGPRGTRVEQYLFTGGRDAVRRESVRAALALLGSEVDNLRDADGASGYGGSADGPPTTREEMP